MNHRRTGLPLWVALIGSGFAGVLIALQSRLNGGLSQEIGNGYLAAFISFAMGAAIMSVLMIFSERGRKGLALVKAELKSKHLPLWALTGGAFGGFFVLTQGLVASLLGVALFTVGVVAGQILGGLLIDRIGIGPGGRVKLTVNRLLGAILALLGALVSVLSNIIGTDTTHGHMMLMFAPVLVGAGVSMQSVVNGLLRSAAQSAVTATFISFVIGALVLAVFAGFSLATLGWPTHWPSQPVLYVGGALGVVFIALAAILVKTAGVLLLSMSNVAGQLLASVALDFLFPLGDGVSVGLLAGSGIALVAVFIASVSKRSKPRD